jgi:hypothetical protein
MEGNKHGNVMIDDAGLEMMRALEGKSKHCTTHQERAAFQASFG